MISPRLLLCLAGSLTLLLASRTASADVPGPRPVCAVEGLGCTSCWQPAGSNEDSLKTFGDCQKDAVATGLVRACSQGQGAGELVYFCPKDTKVETKIVGGGCAGCATGAGSAPTGLLALALGLGIAAMRRRRAGGFTG